MNKKMKSFIVVLLMILGALMLNAKDVVAVSEGELYKSQVEDYIKLAQQTLKNHVIFSEKLEKCEKVQNPFIIYHVGEEWQDKLYYYPVSDEKGVIQFMVEAVIIDGEAKCNLSTELVELINQIPYENEEFLVYLYENNIYVETPSMKVSALDFYNEPVQVLLATEKVEWDYDFEEKRTMIKEAEEKMVEFSPVNVLDENELCVVSEQNLVNEVKLELSNPVGQYGYGMCWACAVATIHNYLVPSKVITGFEVCNSLGIGYNAGASIYDEQDALARYNIIYNSLRLSMLSWEQLTGNIDVAKPIIVNGQTSSGVQHVVTICGYVGTKSSTDNVIIWDSSINGGSGGEDVFTYNSGYFSSLGYVYSWMESLSYQ